MRVLVKLFAILKQRAGVSEISVDLAESSTIATAASAIIAQHPSLEALLPGAAYAVNRAYVPQTTLLKDGDELAIIPPVSGG